MSRHYSVEALHRLLYGPADAAETARAARHVTHCPSCKATAMGRLGRAPARPAGAGNSRNLLLALLQTEAAGILETLAAEGRWAEIRDLDPKEQERRVRSSTTFQTIELFETALAEAKVTGRSDPYLGESLARTALLVADLLPERSHSPMVRHDLRAEGLTVIANCRRLAADFPEATAALAEAWRCLAAGTGDPGTKAATLSIQASLDADLGRLENALTHARQAVEICRRLQDWRELGHNAVLAANILLALGSREEALDTAYLALERMPAHSTRLIVLAKMIVVGSLVDLGRPLAALPDFMEARELCEQADPGLRLQLLHCEARLLDGLGHAVEAERLFRHAIRLFFDQELYKQAFVSFLNLFESYCRRGALPKAAALCEEAIAATSQAGPACNDLIRRTWEELLATVRLRQLSAAELVAARQFLTRHWSNGTADPFTLPREPLPAGATEPPLAPPRPPAASARPTGPEEPLSFLGRQAAHEDYDRQLIVSALQGAGGNLSAASRILRVSRNTLKRRIRYYGLGAGDPGEADPDA